MKITLIIGACFGIAILANYAVHLIRWWRDPKEIPPGASSGWGQDEYEDKERNRK